MTEAERIEGIRRTLEITGGRIVPHDNCRNCPADKPTECAILAERNRTGQCWAQRLGQTHNWSGLYQQSRKGGK